jgi:hypothetical protein
MTKKDRRRWVPPVLRDAGEAAEGGYVLGVRETRDHESWALPFMECTDAEDEQQVALGMDTYCLVVDPGQATHYGGARECEIDELRLRLVLTEDAATALGLPADACFAFDLTPRQVDMLRRGLRRVLTSGRADTIPRQKTQFAI